MTAVLAPLTWPGIAPKAEPSRAGKRGRPSCLGHSCAPPASSVLCLHVEPGTPVLTSFSCVIVVLNFSVYWRESVLVHFCPESSSAPKKIYPPMPQWPSLHTKVYWENSCRQCIKGSVYHLPLRGTIQESRAPGWYWHYCKNNVKFCFICRSLSFVNTGTVSLICQYMSSV